MSRRPEWWLTLLAKIWPITWVSAKAAHWPVVGPVVKKPAVPLFSCNNFNLTYLAINKNLGASFSTFLPTLMVEKLIRESFLLSRIMAVSKLAHSGCDRRYKETEHLSPFKKNFLTIVLASGQHLGRDKL
jgi:hypothetical protein